ncbi:MAG: DUF262 domain-containing protein [Nitrospira sp.]|nr:DUF262 domain-containing protein [Nitrospira sp.]
MNKTLTAEIKTIREIFQYAYLIPEYQRPYSWDKDECLQLVDDLVDFHNEKDKSNEQPYSLGCMVITRETGQCRWSVIDGQQRLTTLLLLIKALHERSGFHVLRECYEKKDPETGEFTGKFSLKSDVIEGDSTNLADVLKHGKDTDKKNRFSKNFNSMLERLDDDGLRDDIDEFRKFIMETLLERVVLLPIQCEREDDALTIFSRLNDRGMPLTDADIFKVNLYKNVADREDEKKKFMDNWKNLMDDNKNDNYNVAHLFKIHMHVLRARDEDTGKEELRPYFHAKTRGRLDNTQAVMECLKKYKDVDDGWNGRTPEIGIWWHILSTSGIDLWQYPLYVFLNKYATYGEDGKLYATYEEGGELTLPRKHRNDFIELIKATARYLFIMGVAARIDHSVRNTIYNVCRDIEHGRDYHRHYRENSVSGKKTFSGKLRNCDYGRYRRDLVLISSALHNSQKQATNREKYEEFLGLGTRKCQIEHILPGQWNNHYEGWTKETHTMDLNKLGNLIPLERQCNIAASNEFFPRKLEKYMQSKNPEALCLEGEYGNRWSPRTLQDRNEDVLNRLKDFFGLEE